MRRQTAFRLDPALPVAHLALGEIAQVQLVLGDHDRALALLDQAMSVPNEVSANEILHFHPWWKPLHNDPRFKAALAKAAPRD